MPLGRWWARPSATCGDLSPRAVEALAGADAICCEDTRRTGRLLQHAGVARPALIVVNDHTEAHAIAGVLERLARGERVAVVTDAGMPGISDPGERLVRAAVEAGHPVEVVPGPSAAITALVASGLPTGRFVFEGFLPRKGAGRTSRLAELAAEPRTIVLYEAPHRVARTLGDLAAACGPERRVSIGRELTKLHEEHWRGRLARRRWSGRRRRCPRESSCSCSTVRRRPRRSMPSGSRPPCPTSCAPGPRPAMPPPPWPMPSGCPSAVPTSWPCGSRRG